MTERNTEWFTGAHYSDYPHNFITFSGLSRETRDRLLGALRVPRVPDERVRALEVGPGYHPLLTDKGFGHSTFLDFSGWFTRHLKAGLKRVAPTRAAEYLSRVRQREWAGQPHLARLYGREQLEQIRQGRQRELDEMVDESGLEPERFSFVRGDLRSLPFKRGAFHLGIVPEVLTHIEPEKRAEAVSRLADAVTHRIVIVDRPPQPMLQLRPEFPLIIGKGGNAAWRMSEQAVDPEELRRVLVGKGFGVRVERHSLRHMRYLEDTPDYFVLVADRRVVKPARRGVRERSSRGRTRRR